MQGLNSVTIGGNLTRDAELRATASGTAILSFSVAVNDRRKNPQSGEWEDYPNFVDCLIFGKRAEVLAQRMVKGTFVCLTGKLRYSLWEDKNGQRRSKLEVVADEIHLESREPKPYVTDVYDSDLPF